MTYEEDHGFELFGQNLFEAANKDQKWIITTPKKEGGRQIEYPFKGTEFEAQNVAKSMGGTYRRAEDNEKQ